MHAQDCMPQASQGVHIIFAVVQQLVNGSLPSQQGSMLGLGVRQFRAEATETADMSQALFFNMHQRAGALTSDMYSPVSANVERFMARTSSRSFSSLFENSAQGW